MKKNLKKYICAVLTAAMLTPLSSAYAKEWVHVSSWAYNDVSNFTNEGLLPESFDSVSDYRAPITVEQFCELLYNVCVKCEVTYIRRLNFFIDTDNKAVNNILSSTDLVTGKEILDIPFFPADAKDSMTPEEIAELERRQNERIDYYKSLNPSIFISYEDGMYFYSKANPSSVLNRECAANILAHINILGSFCQVDISEVEVPEDISYPDASPEAYRDIYLTKKFGIMDATKDPKDNMTIEQAITAIYRLWKNVSNVPLEDGSGIVGSEETLIQTYDNGVEEYKIPLHYVLKKDGAVLKQFESDIYKNIYCTDTADGRRIAAAQTYNEDTELYDLADGHMITKLNNLTDGMDSEYVITKSSDAGPMYFGLCAYDGSTVLEPKYSMEEINILRNNGFKGLEMPYRKPDGWIYYSDWNDNGKMYRIDSNGENKQLLCEEDCFNTKYIDGYLYYSVRGENENKLFCMKSDGTEKEQISNGYAYIYTKYDFSEKEFGSIDGWLYYIEADENAPDIKGGMYVFTAKDSAAFSENKGGYLWRLKHTPAGTVKEQVSDFKLLPIARNENCMYFSRCDSEHGESYMLTKDGLQKLDLDNKVLTLAALNSDTAFLSLHDDVTNTVTTVCAPIGGTEFTECTYNYDDPYCFEENGIEYYPIEHLSDSRYQIGYGNNMCFAKNMTSGEISFIDISGSILDRGGDILYIQGYYDNTLYTYNIATTQTSVLAENVLSAYELAGDFFVYTNTDNNLMSVNIKDGRNTEVYPNTGTLRYGKFESLTRDKNNHLLKIDTDGRCIDLTGSHVKFYGYVAYTD